MRHGYYVDLIHFQFMSLSSYRYIRFTFPAVIKKEETLSTTRITTMFKKKIYSLFKNGKLKLIMGFRSFYYKHFYGRQIPLAVPLENTVTSWEQRYKFAETNIQAKSWDKEYSSDKWNFLHNLDELSRYSILIGYMAHLKPGGAFLDVGCGDGILFYKYQPYGFTSYTGIDISEVAIQKLSNQEVENTSFVSADAENFQPSELYDAIIFNESIYYFKEPMKAIEHYKKFLKERGVIITSIYKKSQRSIAINRLMNSTYRLLDETYCRNGEKTWICSVYNPISKQ